MGESIILQRRNLKVEVQLSSFETFAGFEKHIKSKFDLDDGVRNTHKMKGREADGAA